MIFQKLDATLRRWSSSILVSFTLLYLLVYLLGEMVAHKQNQQHTKGGEERVERRHSQRILGDINQSSDDNQEDESFLPIKIQFHAAKIIYYDETTKRKT